ncbi:MAG: methyl-accepting chemotaxis protein [Alkalispirochaeta sp.]
MTLFLLGALAGGAAAVTATTIVRRAGAARRGARGDDGAEEPLAPPGGAAAVAEPAQPEGPVLDQHGTHHDGERENGSEEFSDATVPRNESLSSYREQLADWYWSMPYVRKLLSLVTEKTEAAAMGLIEKYQEVHSLASSAGEEARSARSTLNEAGDGRGVDALINATRERIASERERSAELARLGERTKEQTRESDELIQRVNSIVDEIGDIADRSKVISINLGIEAAKIGKLGAPFKVIADQLRMLNTSTGEASRRAGALMEDFGAFQTRLVEDWQQTILENVSEAGESARITEETIESLVSAIEEMRAVFDRLIERTIASEGSMDEILAHLQFQDITRQQVENVDDILVDLVEQTKERMEGEIDMEHADSELIARLEEKLKHRFKVYDEESVLGGSP